MNRVGFTGWLMPLLLVGCASQHIVEPTKITLNDAVNQVAEALHNVQNKYPYDQRVGLMTDSAVVQFQIAASEQNTTNATLNVANVGLPSGTIGGSLSNQDVVSGNRGNTITLNFKNIATADMSNGIFAVAKGGSAQKGGKGAPAGTAQLTPEQIKMIQELLPKIVVMMKNPAIENMMKQSGD